MSRGNERTSRQRGVLTSVALRLSTDILAGVDALVPRFSTKARDATRSEILRVLIDAGLESVEQDLADGRSAAEVFGVNASERLHKQAPRSGERR